MPFNGVAGSQWIKHYCQYQAKSKTLPMIPYNHLQGKITTTETVKVNNCLCKTEDSAEKFRFVVHGEDLTQVLNNIVIRVIWRETSNRTLTLFLQASLDTTRLFFAVFDDISSMIESIYCTCCMA